MRGPTKGGRRIASLLIRVLIGAVFIAAGALKLLDPAAFAWNIYQYGLVPRTLIEPLAVALPVLEIAAGGGLIFNRPWGYAATGGMLLLFMAVLTHALVMGLNVDCGCFSPGEPGPEGLRQALGRDLVMLIGLALAWRFSPRSAVRTTQEQGDTISSSPKEDVS